MARRGKTKFKMTREELYEKVWSKPMSVLSRELGVSDVGLSKICKRLNVPTPNRGYWRNLERGYAVEKRPPLPAGSQTEAAEFWGPLQSTPKKTAPVLKIPVPARLSSPHELIKKRRAFLEMPPKERAWASREHYLDIRVSKASCSRAYRIIDTILKEGEKRGVQFGFDERGGTIAKIGYQTLQFYLSERSKRIVKEVPNSWKNDGSTHTMYECEPSGTLYLKIEEYGDEVRTKWEDGKRQRVEDGVGEFLEALFVIAEQKKLREEERRRREAKAAWVARKNSRAKERRETLYREVEQYERLLRVERYLEALKGGKVKVTGHRNLRTWIRWIEVYMASGVSGIHDSLDWAYVTRGAE